MRGTISSSTLESHLEALEQEDRAADVDLALGFVSSLEIFTESQEKLGLARFQGRHAILRAMDNAEEHQAITRVFTKLDENERDALYRERKLHKEITLVLHGQRRRSRRWRKTFPRSPGR